MAFPNPLLPLHTRAGALTAPYGVGPPGPIDVVQTYGDLGQEYASLRTACVLLDQPQRAVLEVTGPDRTEFLGRMLTQELKGITPGQVRRSFWLNRKGRIDADLRVVHLQDRTLLEVDALAAERARAGLNAYIITEDFAIRLMPSHRLSVHGPTGLALLSAFTNTPEAPEVLLAPGRVADLSIAGAAVWAYREDTAGVPGVELIVPAEHALAVYQALIEAGHSHDGGGGLGSRIRLVPAGWHAYNVARIEAGTPLYNLDFGPESLPAESGVLSDRVSFTKGCYLGQEIVARMHARGQSKQTVVALRFEPVENEGTVVPEVGAVLTTPGATDTAGAVTSSTLAPSLGSVAIALAQVRSASATPGTALEAHTPQGRVLGSVMPALSQRPDRS